MRDAAITNGRVRTHLHALVNTILGGNLPAPVSDLLTASRLIALAKPGGGTRPIAIGECITRLTAKAALAAMGEAARAFFLPLQYGVAVPGGAEAVIHVARAYLDKLPNSLVLQTDISNAFNSISRQAIATAFMGPDRGASQFLSGQLQEMAKPLPLLEKADPQVASLLLTRCISRRVAYLTRTTPFSLLPRETWSQWGTDLLAALLTACHLRVPTCRTEQARVWAQASLPPSLGGIGITDPLVEGVFGFAASFTQAALFIASLDGAPEGALAQARDHMQLPADTTTPLHTWLSECEAALPDDAREVLEKERLERTDLRL
ncbi:unnamed protein product [Closterium sp. NIES-53]